MYFRISQDKLSELISIASKAISPNSPLAVLTGIKFDVKKDAITLTGSDADISIRVTEQKNDSFTYEVEEEGSIIINKNYITDIIKKIDSDIVEMEIADGNLTKISGNTAVFHINGFKASDYPLLDFNAPETSFEIEGSLLKKMVSQTYFATSVSDTRPALSGINLSGKDGVLTAVSTDSYRLAKKSVPMNLPYDFSFTILAKSLLDISRSFEDSDKVTVAYTNKKAQFFTDRVMIQTRLIEGNYPDTSRFVPANFDYELVINRREMSSAISRSSFIKSENDQYAVLKLEMDASSVVLSSRSQEIGSSTQNLNFESYTGSPLELSFSSKYVEEALNGLDGEKILIRFSGTMKPFVLTSLSDDTTLQLVLPVRSFN